MSPYKRNILTAIVVIFGLGVLVWMILEFSGKLMVLFKPHETPVVFMCDRGDGLDSGSPVLYQGVTVGKVSKVERTGDNEHVRIEAQIVNQPPLPHNLVGTIRLQSQLSSSSQVELRLDGKPQGTLEAGEQIQIAYVGWSLIPPEVTSFVTDVRRQELVRHVDETILSLKTQVEKMGAVADSVQKLIGDPKIQSDLRSSLASVRDATERASRIGASLEQLTTNTNTTLTKTNAAVDTLTRDMGNDLERLGATLKQFEEISAKINNGKGTAGAMINDPRLYDELADTAKELNVVSASLSRLVDQWEHEGVSLKLSK